MSEKQIEKLMELHKNWDSGSKEIMSSIKVVHGDNAHRAIKIQLDVLTLNMDLITALSAMGIPPVMLSVLVARAKHVHTGVVGMALAVATSGIEDDTKAEGAVTELAKFVNQLGMQYCDVLQKSTDVGGISV